MICYPAFIDFLANNFWPFHTHDRPPGAFCGGVAFERRSKNNFN